MVCFAPPIFLKPELEHARLGSTRPLATAEAEAGLEGPFARFLTCGSLDRCGKSFFRGDVLFVPGELLRSSPSSETRSKKSRREVYRSKRGEQDLVGSRKSRHYSRVVHLLGIT